MIQRVAIACRMAAWRNGRYNKRVHLNLAIAGSEPDLAGKMRIIWLFRISQGKYGNSDLLRECSDYHAPMHEA
jgi:hypothetical protein